MAIQITASVGKKAGLPNYGSKSFTLSCTKEVTEIRNLEAESIKLHELLEKIVEAQIEKDENDVNNDNVAPVNRLKNKANGEGWHCSDKQRGLILKLISDHSLEEVAEEMSQEMFGCSPEGLNKLQASGLIQRILEEHASKKPSKGKNGNGRFANGGVR